MKKVARYGGIIVIVCALVLYLIAGNGYDNNKSTEVTGGIMVNGQFRPVASGSMGGSSQNRETFSTMQTFSLIFIGLGGFMFLVSFVLKDEKNSPYV